MIFYSLFKFTIFEEKEVAEIEYISVYEKYLLLIDRKVFLLDNIIDSSKKNNAYTTTDPVHISWYILSLIEKGKFHRIRDHFLPY